MSSQPATIRKLGKSILLGGTCGGLLSLVPLINLLNIFFMFWIVVGVGISMNRLTKTNGRLAVGDALLAGSLSGLISGAIFAAAGSLFILRLDSDQLITTLERMRMFSPDTAEEMIKLVQSSHFHALLLLSLATFMLLAIVIGGVSALLWRLVMRAEKIADDQ